MSLSPPPTNLGKSTDFGIDLAFIWLTKMVKLLQAPNNQHTHMYV